jgi:hypothetical protein
MSDDDPITLDDAWIEDLVDAAWQVLEDMGARGHCCSAFAKAKLRIALELFIDRIGTVDELMSLDAAVRVVSECDER